MAENEVDKLFADLPKEDKEAADIFNEKPVEQTDAKAEPAKEDEPRKNRRHRRLEEQLQQERDARIAAEARAQALSETQKFANETGSDSVDDRYLRIYGDTPETRQAWKLQQEMLNEYSSKAKQEALAEIEQRQALAQKEQKQFESFIDKELESIEDEFNVDVTSDSPAARKARREFLETVQSLSPKDENGTITSYADFGGAWEMYQLKKGKDTQTTDRQKDISDRSMAKSGGSAGAQAPEPTAGFRGWMRDLNL